MNFKFIFVLIFVLILSVGTVCADGNSTDNSDDTQDTVDVVGSEYVIDNSNYNTYFDDEGKILETANITDGDTIKFGDVTNKTFVFDKNLTITSNSSDNAMNNSFISFVNGSSGSSVYNLTLLYQNSTKTAISMENAESINFYSNNIIVDSADDSEEVEMYVIIAELCDNLIIADNNITFSGKSNGSRANAAIDVSTSDSVLFKNNIILASFPSIDIDWTTSMVYSEAVSFASCSNLTIDGNTISVAATEIIGDTTYDTVYALNIQLCDGVNVTNNDISVSGNSSRMYGLVINAEDFIIDNNTISLISDVLQTNALEIGGTSSGEVTKNNLTSYAPDFAYGIDTWKSDINVTYVENLIDVSADFAYGAEFMGNEEYFVNNTVLATGNRTIAVASSSKEFTMSENSIYANGYNLISNNTSFDLFGMDTVGVIVLNSSATIFNNTIESTSSGIFVDGGEVFISNNKIDVEANASTMDSYGILGSETSVNIIDNVINYAGYSDGSVINNAILLSDSPNSTILNNVFEISIPSIPVNYTDYPNVITYSEGIVVSDSDDVIISNNSIELEYNSVPNNDSEYDTIYVIDIVNSIANVTLNKIEAEGNNYIYAIRSSKGGEISNNTIDLESNNYATAINIEDEGTFDVSGNDIVVYADAIAYGIYSQKYAGKELNATYSDNLIETEAPIVYAARLSGSNEEFTQNEIIANGVYAMGIGSDSDNLTIESNTIETISTDNETEVISYDTIGVETVGIKVNNTSIITDNSVKTNGEYAVNINESASTVYDNHLVSDLLFGDNSVYTVNESAAVYNNTPDYDAFINIDDEQVLYKSNSSVYATLATINGTPISNETLTFVINDEEYNVTTDEKGTASVPVDLPVGRYDVSVTFNPGEEYTPVTEEATLEVDSTIDSDDVEQFYGKDAEVNATFIDSEGNPLANGTNVSFTVDNETFTVPTDENGTASLSLSNLTAGEHEVNITNPVNNETITTTVTVNPTVTSDGLEKLYKDSNPFEATFVDSDGNPLVNQTVQFEVNGVTYNRTTNENGTAKLNINLRPGDYVVTSTNPSNNETVQTNITVKSTIVSSDLVKYYKNGTQYLATFLDADGNPLVNETVSFNVNGITYYRKTNENGTAKLNINLPAGNWIVSATNPVDNLTISNSIEVLPVLSAADLTKKYGTSDQFVAHVIDGQGNNLAGATVTFNINGIFYDRVTNSDGDARLNIRLPAGKYIITSIYNGAAISNTITVTE